MELTGTPEVAIVVPEERKGSQPVLLLPDRLREIAEAIRGILGRLEPFVPGI